MIEIKAKTPSGVIQTIRCAEIIEIDGKPWLGASTDGSGERLARLEGCVESLMRAVFDEIETTGEGDSPQQ